MIYVICLCTYTCIYISWKWIPCSHPLLFMILRCRSNLHQASFLAFVECRITWGLGSTATSSLQWNMAMGPFFTEDWEELVKVYLKRPAGGLALRRAQVSLVPGSLFLTLMGLFEPWKSRDLGVDPSGWDVEPGWIASDLMASNPKKSLATWHDVGCRSILAIFPPNLRIWMSESSDIHQESLSVWVNHNNLTTTSL